MSDSKSKAYNIGFSTGALERNNFRGAINWLRKNGVQSVELSALRLAELEPLVNSLESLPIKKFRYVSFHAPSAFPRAAERRVVDLLWKVVSRRGWNIIVHPDVIRNPKLWRRFNDHLLIENMDRRKATGRTVNELENLFRELPNARLCLDLAHARQLDTTLTLLSDLIGKFSNRIAQIHISELDSFCQHQPMSNGAVSDYQKLTNRVRANVPVVIEAMLEGDANNMRMDELYWAYTAMYTHRSATKGESEPAKLSKTLWKVFHGHKDVFKSESPKSLGESIREKTTRAILFPQLKQRKDKMPRR